MFISIVGKNSFQNQIQCKKNEYSKSMEQKINFTGDVIELASRRPKTLISKAAADTAKAITNAWPGAIYKPRKLKSAEIISEDIFTAKRQEVINQQIDTSSPSSIYSFVKGYFDKIPLQNPIGHKFSKSEMRNFKQILTNCEKSLTEYDKEARKAIEEFQAELAARKAMKKSDPVGNLETIFLDDKTRIFHLSDGKIVKLEDYEINTGKKSFDTNEITINQKSDDNSSFIRGLLGKDNKPCDIQYSIGDDKELIYIFFKPDGSLHCLGKFNKTSRINEKQFKFNPTGNVIIADIT